MKSKFLSIAVIFLICLTDLSAQFSLPSGQADTTGSEQGAGAAGEPPVPGAAEIEGLLEEYEKKPAARNAANLARAYWLAGEFGPAADYYRRAAESYRKKEDRARAYYNAGTAVIEANRAAMETAAGMAGGPPGTPGGAGTPGGGGTAAGPKAPPLQSAIDYLHRSLDLEPGRAAGAYNMEIAKLMLARQEARQEQEEQNGDEGENKEQKQDGSQDSREGDSGQDGGDEQEGDENSEGGQDSPADDGEPNEDARGGGPEGREEGQEGASGQPEEGENPEDKEGAGAESGEEGMSEEELQERLSEILGSEEENRQLREALLEKRGGIREVERDW